MGIFGGGSAGKEKKAAKQTIAANQTFLGGLNVTTDALFKQQQKAEEAKTLLSGALGAPGTYEDDYESFVTKNQGLFDYTPQGAIPKSTYLDKTAGELLKLSHLVPSDSGAAQWKDQPDKLKSWLKESGVAPGTFSEEAISEFVKDPTAKGVIRKNKEAAGQGGYAQIANAPLPDIVDPLAYTQYQLSTRQGRDISYLTAQASQLARGEGEMWDSIQQSVIGTIKDGSAQLMRQSADEIQRWAAQGGTARRMAVEEVARIQTQERINRDSIQQMRESQLNLLQWGQANLRENLSFTQSWISNLGGVRDAFVAAQNQMVQYYQSAVLPLARQYTIQNYQLSLVKNTKPWMKILGPILKVVGAVATMVGVAFGWTGIGLGLVAGGAALSGAGSTLSAKGTGASWGSALGSGAVSLGTSLAGGLLGAYASPASAVASGGASASLGSGYGVIGDAAVNSASTAAASGTVSGYSMFNSAPSSGGLFSSVSNLGNYFSRDK